MTSFQKKRDYGII